MVGFCVVNDLVNGLYFCLSFGVAVYEPWLVLLFKFCDSIIRSRCFSPLVF